MSAALAHSRIRKISSIIRTSHLCKSYGSGPSTTQVLSDLDLEVAPGEFLTIMGSSGSGKSTLLHLLGGLDSPSHGSIWLEEKEITGQSEKSLAQLRRSKIGFVFQESSLLPHLTLLENVLLAGYLVPETSNPVEERAIDILAKVGIEHLVERLPAEVSGGERQRCAIARALINQPQILMADEPTGNLNSASSIQVLNLLSQFHRNGQSIIMVTHDVPSACRAQRIIYLRDGRTIDHLTFDPFSPINYQTREQLLINWLNKKGW